MYELPLNYKENAVKSRDIEDEFQYWDTFKPGDFWQFPAYRVCQDYIKSRHNITVMEIGCGVGEKGRTFLLPTDGMYVGIDQASGIRRASQHSTEKIVFDSVDLEDEGGIYDILRKYLPDLIVCIDVIEHIQNPDILLEELRKYGHYKKSSLFISTPIRDLVESKNVLGPPRNPLHVREWTFEEFSRYLESHGFRIDKSWKLFPRRYTLSAQEIRRLAKRLLQFKSIPDNRYNQLHHAVISDER